MKTFLAALTVASILAIGPVSFAQGTGGRGGGHMMGPGYEGGHMMEPGYGSHMSGMTNRKYGTAQDDQKFLDETAGLRRELHNKRFEYAEAVRNPKTTGSTIRELEKEIYQLEERISEKIPEAHRGYRSY